MEIEKSFEKTVLATFFADLSWVERNYFSMCRRVRELRENTFVVVPHGSARLPGVVLVSVATQK